MINAKYDNTVDNAANNKAAIFVAQLLDANQHFIDTVSHGMQSKVARIMTILP